MVVLKIFTVVCLLYVASAQIPIPRREVGYVYMHGRDDALIHLDVYIDLICPDSKQALPTLIQVADFYGPAKLQFKAHIFPLPYHRNSWVATKGLHVIASLTKGNETFDWINLLYKNIDSLVNSATDDLTQVQIISKFAKLATDLGISAPTFVSTLKHQEHIESDTREAWKYACTRGVAGTPTFMVNDIVSSTATQFWTVDQWKQLIDTLLN